MPTQRPTPLLPAALFALAGAAGAAGAEASGSALPAAPASAARVDRPHLLLITVDTLRADFLHCYGYPHPTSPAIDRLAERGVLFRDTLTTIGKTGPAISSLFSSLYPPTHGARRNGVAMRPDVPVLAELLEAHGYATAAFISNWTLRRNLAGVHRGFAHWDQEFNRSRYTLGPSERDADQMTTSALAWLERTRRRAALDHEVTSEADRPLFLWVHYSEPHTPYRLHQDFAPPRPAAGGDGALKRWRYASEVAYTDSWIARLLAGAAPFLPRERTLVVFSADHGESLGEHAYWGHGKNTHWPNLRIPLVIAGPGVPAGARVESPASIIDVLPTLADLIGFTPPLGIAGESLVNAWRAVGASRDRPRYAFGDRPTSLVQRSNVSYEEPLEISLVVHGTKTIYDFTQHSLRYYDLDKDWGELHALERPPVAVDPPLSRALASWYRSLVKYDTSRALELSAEDVDQLRALGYVGGE